MDQEFIDSSLDYGNGDGVEYTYDDQGRVTAQTYEDGDTVTYTYDNTGALATVTDSATGRTTTYYYDLTDRMVKYVESGTGYSHSVAYEYNALNNLTRLVEAINGTQTTTTYTYDEDNRLTGVSNGISGREYTYDDFGRLNQQQTKHGGNVLLTEGFTYRAVGTTGTTGQISAIQVSGENFNTTYAYTYDGNGNILTVTEGASTTSYVYDTANQLVRENNQAAGKTWVWAYDNAGNILSRTEYAYTTGDLGVALDTVLYQYGDESWGDLLTSYDGKSILYDQIGNPIYDGTWTYSWEHGRQLSNAVASNGDGTYTSITYTYDADGMRTGKTVVTEGNTVSYTYVYNGGLLMQEVITTVIGSGDTAVTSTNTLNYTYDPNGTPLTVNWNGILYYYVTNLQGDVIALIQSSGMVAASYTYDAWGNILTTNGVYAASLGEYNALKYRGYVYDTETEFYYLQSRYYNPEIGRFINADAFVSTGQGLLGNNMYAYCLNNPVAYSDPTGHLSVFGGFVDWIKEKIVDPLIEDLENYDSNNTNEQDVIDANFFSAYKNRFVFKVPTNRDSASFYFMFIGDGVTNPNTIKHEYGHTVQLQQRGWINYTKEVAIPSVYHWALLKMGKLTHTQYHNLPWEAEADMLGGANGYPLISYAPPENLLEFAMEGLLP